MKPQDVLRFAQDLRASCKAHDLRVPAGVSNLELVQVAEKLGLLTNPKSLTKTEVKKLLDEVSGDQDTWFLPM